MNDLNPQSSLSRRNFLLAGAAAGLASAMPGFAAASGRRLGIELYTVQASLDADLSGTLAALSKIGYKFAETGVLSDIPSGTMRKALDDAGLKCPCAHLRFSAADPAPLFDDAHVLGAHYAMSSVLVDVPPSAVNGDRGAGLANFMKSLAGLTLDDWRRTAEHANQIGAKAKQAGLQYAYHNHNFEFKDLGDGQTGYDLMLKETDPELVKFELDCGWMVAAGHSPVEYLNKYRGRFCTIHVKDFVAAGKPTTTLGGPDNPKGTELGKGYIDYKPIFPAADRSGVEYYFSEQEPPIVGMTALEAAKVNYDYMRSI